MAEAKGPEKPKDGESQGAGYLTMAAQKLVPLLVSAVVSVGFVAFAGKAVLWTRFQALQVPADQVVRVVPQSEAVAIGASMLLIFGLFGLLAALTVFLVDRAGRATPGMSRGLLAILAIEAVATVWLTDGKPLEARIFATEVVLLGVGAIFWSTFVFGLIALDREVPDFIGDEKQQDFDPGPFYHPDETGKETSGLSPRRVRRAVIAALGLGLLGYLLTLLFGGDSELARVIALGVVIVVLLAAILRHCRDYFRKEATKAEENEEAEKQEREEKEEARVRRLGEEMAREARRKEEEKKARERAKAERARRERRKPRGFTLKPAGVFFTVAFAALAVGAPPFVLHEWWLAVALGAVAVLGIGLWRIAYFAKKHVVWYGLAVFISVPLFGTMMLMARNIDEPKVQPMALIRSTDGPDEAIQGLYVTETSDRVYFANVATEGCEEKVTAHSGRLLWVPKDEVVAISIGPLQNVKEAGRSALEMSYDLTPGIETGGATIDLPEPAPAAQPAADKGKGAPDKGTGSGGEAEEAEGSEGDKGEKGKGGKAGGEGDEGGGEEGGEKEGSAVATGNDTRLQNVGPAVRPNFGTGLRIEPEIVSPGAEATLRLSHENAEVEGFGPARAGHNLRLGGKVVDIAKEPAGAAEGAEYIETERGRLIALAKEGPFVEKEDGEFVPLEGDADDEGEGLYVKLDDPAVRKIGEKPATERLEYVPVEDRGSEEARVAAGAPKVTLAGGTFEGRPWESEEASLAELRLLRQAWHPDHIRFHVPDDAHTGVVTVECDQLAGAPLLQVPRAPSARIVAQMQPSSTGVSFDSSHSSGNGEAAAEGAEEALLRRWRVDGVSRGHGDGINARMPPRPRPYSVELTVTDLSGHTDTAKLQVLRLPTPGLGVVRDNPKALEAIEAGRKTFERLVEEESPKQIEIDGYTGSAGKFDHNLKVSLAEDDDVRKSLLPEPEEIPTGELAVPVEELGYGEGCPIDSRRGPRAQSPHVDVFLLTEGIVVKPANGCHAGSQKIALWHPPAPAAGSKASSSASASSAP